MTALERYCEAMGETAERWAFAETPGGDTAPAPRLRVEPDPTPCGMCRMYFEHGNLTALHRSCASLLAEEIGRPGAPFVLLARGDQ